MYSVFHLTFRIQCILVCISEVLRGIYLEYIRIHFALLEYIYSTEYTAIYCIIYLKIYVITNEVILITNVVAPRAPDVEHFAAALQIRKLRRLLEPHSGPQTNIILHWLHAVTHDRCVTWCVTLCVVLLCDEYQY